MPAKPSIALVGPGNLGSALAVALRRAGYRIDEVISRDQPASRRRARSLARRVGARATTLESARLRAPLLWIAVTDDAIPAVVRTLAPRTNWKGMVALHSSGALSSDQLRPLRLRGASVATLHPMMTFVSGAQPSLRGVPFAVEGDPRAVAVARRIARDLGGFVFPIPKRNKPLYHVYGSFSSPLIVVTLATAERIARAAGVPAKSVRQAIAPIVRQTVENYLRRGAAAAFSGPVKRGDVGTVRRHLKALKKIRGARAVYVALIGGALEVLPSANKPGIKRLLRGS
ncbi:MAG TPA: Rossmann-like and DUF2520 domain-containing protein [Terriglobales bacterium]|nr:Rossmann-like and DUF2520 domain-containing protein [Terriglobales bacterium]